MNPRLDIIFPVLPPALDGIGDYTACLSRALAGEHQVRVLTAQEDTLEIEGVRVERAFSLDRRRGITEVVEAVAADPPEWCLLQFNQFSYGRWGLNPYVPLTLRRLRKRLPEVRLAIMFHEDFVPVTSWKNVLMTTWQRAQFFALGRMADVVFFSIEPWVRRYRPWFPGAAVHHLPVGSNIPHVGISKAAARGRLGIDSSTFVAGVFGTLHASRLEHFIEAGVRAASGVQDDLAVLYVGPDGAALQETLGDLRVIDAGRLPAEDVSVHLAAMDVHLAPFVDGVSTRRGSFMAGIQHGVTTVGTRGPLTDELLTAEEGRAVLLSPVGDKMAYAEAVRRVAADEALRQSVGAEGQRLYRELFSWEVIAERLGKLIANTEYAGAAA